jgi:hypothetical protein
MRAIVSAPIMSDPASDEELAAQLVNEALAGFETSVSPAEFEAMREELLDRLLITKAGQQLLRQVRLDPTPDRSEDLVAPGKEASADLRTVLGIAKKS